MTVKIRFKTYAEAAAFLRGISYVKDDKLNVLGMESTPDYQEVWLEDKDEDRAKRQQNPVG